MKNINNTLLESQVIEPEQFDFLEAIRTGKIVSLYFELRLVLYLGIMLLTGGVGYLVYENMGSIGHLLSMALILISIIGCFYFIRKHAQPYTNSVVVISHTYFDYVLILAALLIISLFTYIQVYFNLVQLLLNSSAIVSSAILLFLAYRFDSKSLLSMGVTAFTASVGINMSPVNWATGELFSFGELYFTAIAVGIFLILVGHLSYVREIKKHFRFTYQNFGLLLYFIGLICAVFMSDSQFVFATILLLSALLVAFYTWKEREFLFFLYSVLAGYIAISFLVFQMLSVLHDDSIILFIYYLPASCIGLVILLVNNKSHFVND